MLSPFPYISQYKSHKKTIIALTSVKKRGKQFLYLWDPNIEYKNVESYLIF